MTGRADPAELFARASEAWRQGRHETATELLEAMIEQEPEHVTALNTLGLIAINRRDGQRACNFLERAVESDPTSAGIWFNHFQALELTGDLERGLLSLDRALAIDPYFVPALIKKAEMLEKLGRRSESAALYRRIIEASPDFDKLPEAARNALAHGREVIRAEEELNAQALSKPLAEVRAAWPGADFERADAYAEHRLVGRKIFVQQPVDGHFPYLPALEFFPRTHFPWLGALEARTEEIRAELLALLAGDDSGFQPYVGFGPTQPVNQWAELNHSRRWSAWFFWQDGKKQVANCARCPATTAILESLPLLDLPGKGPTAMFSILEPGTRIPAHTGSNNVRTTIHLPLVVPKGCGFRVGSQVRQWRVGEAWAFDDTIEHEAWNESNEPRAILIIDVWNPFLSEAERALVRVVG